MNNNDLKRIYFEVEEFDNATLYWECSSCGILQKHRPYATLSKGGRLEMSMFLPTDWLCRECRDGKLQDTE